MEMLPGGIWAAESAIRKFSGNNFSGEVCNRISQRCVVQHRRLYAFSGPNASPAG